MSKRIKIITMLGSVAAIVAPIAATVSCGSDSKKHTDADANKAPVVDNTTDTGAVKAPEVNLDPSHTGVTASKGAAAGATKTAYGNDVEDGTFAPDADKAPAAYWGYSTMRSATHGPADNERKMRNQDGHPKSTNSEYVQWFWNFRPGQEGHGIEDANIKAAVNGGVWKDGKTFGTKATITNAASRVEDLWGSTADQKFNMATVRDVAPRVYGEKLKDTQSAFTDYDYMNCLEATGGGVDIGFAQGRTNPQNYITGNWTYSASESTWRAGTKWPSGPQIDAAHRNGVPITGTITFQNGAWQNDDFLMFIDPGADGSYPVAKGMVEVADYYGFDGWMINFEGEPQYISVAPGSTWAGQSDVVNNGQVNIGKAVSKFMDAWRGYAHADMNKDNPTADQKANGYYHRPQMVQAYGGMHAQGEFEKGIVDNSDVYFWVQGHGATGGDEVRRLGTRAAEYAGKNSDRFHANSGINWPEDGFTDTMKGQGTTLHAIAAKAGDGTAAPATGADGKPVGQRIKENVASLWIYSYGQQSVLTDEQFYNSFAGDPRHEDTRNHTSASDGFQERTPIVGHKNWTTDFDWGSGKTFNMWGQAGLNNSLVGSSDAGWSAWEMQSFQPTYKWIVDEYDAYGNPTVNKDNLPVDANEKIQRKINPVTNNEADDAWFGGTTLDYSGKLDKGESFENKLFASAIPVQDGDKFTIKVKNTDLIKGKKADINLLAWTKDGAVDVPTMGKDGYFTGKNVVRDGATPYGERLHAGSPDEWINPQGKTVVDPKYSFTDDATKTYKYYQNEEAWNYKRNKNSIAPVGDPVAIGSTGWSEITYDLSKYKGKTLVDFGIQATANGDGTDFSELRLGEMHFDAKDNSLGQANNVKMSKFVTNNVWTLPLEKTARIEWTNTFTDANGTPITDIAGIADARAKIRDYIVYYADDAWNLNSIGWVGANSVAYLKKLDKEADHQNVVIMAIDNDYNVVSQSSAVIQLQGGK